MREMARNVLIRESINRRSFVAGGLCALCGPSMADQFLIRNCIRYQTEPNTLSSELRGLSGYDYSYDFMNGLVIILREIMLVFDVKASFGFYDDPVDNPNALMSNTPLLPLVTGGSATDGTVAFGRNLVSTLRKEARDFGSSITAVCSHEFGHVLQYKTGIIDNLLDIGCGDLPVELHADFMCGYFGAHRKITDDTYDVATQAETQFHYADKNKAPELLTHGTPDQRGDAVYAGFLLGRQGLIAPDIASKKGLEYVFSLNLC